MTNKLSPAQFAIALVCCISLCSNTHAARMQKTQKPKPRCLATIHASRDTFAWIDKTKSYDEEQKSLTVPAQAFSIKDHMPIIALQRFVTGTEPLLFQNQKGEIFINRTAFTDTTRIQLARAVPEAPTTIGRVTSTYLQTISARKIAEFLLISGVLQSWAHLEAENCLIAENDTDIAYSAEFQVTHIFYTSRKNEASYAFKLGIDKKTGSITVSK